MLRALQASLAAAHAAAAPIDGDRAALVRLYIDTGGAGWARKGSWGSARSPCVWEGLSLEYTQITGRIEAVTDLPELTYLDLSNNKLNGTIDALAKLTRLYYVDLSSWLSSWGRAQP
eukprot:gene621-10484_t